MIEHEEIRGKNQQVSQSEGCGGIHDLQRANVIHERGSGGHEGSHDQGARHGGHVELHIRLKTARGAAAELIDLEGLAPEGVNHADLTQALLRDGEQIALALVDVGGLISHPDCIVADRPDHRRQDRERGKRERPIHSHHHKKCRHQHDDRRQHGRETFIVNRLDALRIVGHAEAGVRAAAGVVELERQVLQRRVKVRAQLEQRLQAHADEKVVRAEIDQPCQEADQNHGQTEPEDDE